MAKVTLSWHRVAGGAQGWQISAAGLLGSFAAFPGSGRHLPGAELVIIRPSRQQLERVRSVQRVHGEGGTS